MNFESVAKNEAHFRATGKAAGGRKFTLKPFSLPVPGDADLKMDGFTCRPADGYTGYYYAQKHKKEKIVLHFTVGHLRGDINSLSSPKRGHVSTAFVVARDGGIYQLHSSAHWSYHLGRGALGGNGTGSKKGIGIEISNYGPLTKRGNNLETAYSSTPGRDIYCTLADTDQYIKLDKPYRGYSYYTAYTDEQYHAIIVLLRYLTASYKIPRKFVPEADRFKTTTATSSNFKGIHSHVNYRKDKFDIGPAFDWDRVVAGVTAEVYSGNAAEFAVKKAEKKVADAKAALKAAQDALAAAEDELADAQDALATAGAGSRGVEMYTSMEQIEEEFPTPRGAVTYDSEDGPEEFDIDKSPFYFEDE